ncbi:hypothetical protein [Enterobacter roggenkampii]|uniref:hypothetical protein n=1 Tax=Enterobacter roggenkampii TaxID=1812935 RepID=UPI001FC7FF7D|nr:hypothetical protein [Enterobacter roggenkampii]
MSSITREQAQKIIDAADEVITALAGTNEDVHPDNSTKMVRLYDDLNDHYAPPEVVRELARIALASLEAEPVAYIRDGFKADGVHFCGGIITAEEHERTKPALSDRYNWKHQPLYIAPPAPVTINAEPVAWLWSHRKHPSEVSLVRLEDDEKAEGAHWSGWSCQALYAAPPAPVSVPNSRAITQYFDTIALEAAREIMCDVNRRHEFLGGEVQLLSRIQCRIDDACRAAMLQCEDVSLTHDGKNHPEDKLGMVDHSGDANEKGNSPVIPDGWVLVPVEPTEDMIVNGFESEPDESFSDEREWEAYDAMSGCQQAAHRARLCRAAMLAAAPRPEA